MKLIMTYPQLLNEAQPKVNTISEIFKSIEFDEKSTLFWDFIKFGYDSNIKFYHYNLLLFAIDKNKIDVADYLVKNTDIDINYTNSDDRNALTFAVVAWASYTNDDTIMKELIVAIIERGSSWNVLFNNKTFLEWLDEVNLGFKNELINKYPDKYNKYLMIKRSEEFNI